MGDIGAKIVEIFWNLFGTITVPGTLAIANWRFGLLGRVLQILVLAFVLVQLFYGQAWYTRTIPTVRGAEMWGGAHPAMYENQVPHCLYVHDYWYTYSSQSKYEPSRCRSLSEGESFIKNGLDIFIPTYMQDEYTITTEISPSSPSSIGSATEPEPASSLATMPTLPYSDCSAVPCTSGTKRMFAGKCLCEENDQFFAQNPEKRILYLNHGYEVTKLNRFGREMKKRVIGRSNLPGDSADTDIMTVFTTEGDPTKPCKLGGKDKWSQKDSEEGIYGPIEDFLRCGGVSLDDLNSRALSTADGASSSPPRVRLTGANINIDFKYVNHNKQGIDHPGVVCFVTVQVVPTWNSRTSVEFKELPFDGVQNTVYRYRYMFGMSFSISTTGDFAWYDFIGMLKLFLSSMVILAIPGQIMTILSLNLAGRLSRIYSSVAIQHLNIVGEFPGLIARTLGYAVNYQRIRDGFNKDNKDPLKDPLREVSILKDEPSALNTVQAFPGEQNASGSGSKPASGSGIDVITLRKALTEILQKEINDKVLNQDELQRMAEVLMYKMDLSSSNNIKLGEFIGAADNNEKLRIADLAACFDNDHVAGCLENVVGDIRNELKKDPPRSSVIQ